MFQKIKQKRREKRKLYRQKRMNVNSVTEKKSSRVISVIFIMMQIFTFCKIVIESMMSPYFGFPYFKAILPTKITFNGTICLISIFMMNARIEDNDVKGLKFAFCNFLVSLFFVVLEILVIIFQ